MKPAGFIIAMLVCLCATGLSANDGGRPSPVKSTDDLLEVAVTYWEEARYELASEALTRLIIRGRGEGLAPLSDELEHRVGMPLLELICTARLRAARLSSEDGSFRLRHVTRNEREVLAEHLTTAYAHALTAPVSWPAPGSDTQPGSQGAAPASRPAGPVSPLPQPVDLSGGRAKGAARRVYVLQEWLDKFDDEFVVEDRRAGIPRRPKEAEGHLRHAIEKLSPSSDHSERQRVTPDFDGSREEAHFFAQHIRYAESLLRERLRYDTDLRRRPEARQEWRRQLGRLGRLRGAVEARAGGALSREEVERLRFVRQRMILHHQAQRERQVLIDNLLIHKTLEETGAEPGTVHAQTIQIEGEVRGQRGPERGKRKLEAQVVPAILPEMLREGAHVSGNAGGATTSRPAGGRAGGESESP